jgi:hypothetical protein
VAKVQEQERVRFELVFTRRETRSCTPLFNPIAVLSYTLIEEEKYSNSCKTPNRDQLL